MTRPASSIAACMLLVAISAGCSADKSTAKPSPTADPTVSTSTACQLLYSPSNDGPLDNVPSVFKERVPTEEQLNVDESNLEELRTVAARAPSDIAAQLRVYVREVQPEIDKHRAHPRRMFFPDTTVWRSAALELLHICEGVGAVG